MRIPDAGPFGETRFDASVRAIVAASLVKRPSGGCVASVFTDATHRFFVFVAGMLCAAYVDRCLAVRAFTMLRRAAWRCAVVVLRFGATVLRPPRGPRRVVAARSPPVGCLILSSLSISMPCLRAADTILRRAVSLADFDAKAVWFHRGHPVADVGLVVQRQLALAARIDVREYVLRHRLSLFLSKVGHASSPPARFRCKERSVWCASLRCGRRPRSSSIRSLRSIGARSPVGGRPREPLHALLPPLRRHNQAIGSRAPRWSGL